MANTMNRGKTKHTIDSPDALKILESLKANPEGLTSSGFMRLHGINQSPALTLLKRLEAAGLVHTEGERHNTIWVFGSGEPKGLPAEYIKVSGIFSVANRCAKQCGVSA